MLSGCPSVCPSGCPSAHLSFRPDFIFVFNREGKTGGRSRPKNIYRQGIQTGGFYQFLFEGSFFLFIAVTSPDFIFYRTGRVRPGEGGGGGSMGKANFFCQRRMQSKQI